MPLSDLHLEETTFRKFNPADPPLPGFEALFDDEGGLIVSTFEGKVREFVYLPRSADRKRCSNYYDTPADFVRIMVDACGLAFDEYGDLRFPDEKARLDNFAISLLNSEHATGYIVVYAGRKATVGEALTRANRARDYLIAVRHVDPQLVMAVDGGYKDELTVFLYIGPFGTTPPVSPTVDPKDVELIYEKPRPRRRTRHQN